MTLEDVGDSRHMSRCGDRGGKSVTSPSWVPHTERSTGMGTRVDVTQGPSQNSCAP